MVIRPRIVLPKVTAGGGGTDIITVDIGSDSTVRVVGIIGVIAHSDLESV